jgi:hypothetical protein
MLPVGLIGFMLPKKLEEGFYADPPKNELADYLAWNPSLPTADESHALGCCYGGKYGYVHHVFHFGVRSRG